MIRYVKGFVMKQLTIKINALKIIGKNANFRTRLMLAGRLVQSKLNYLVPLFGGAPDYLIHGLHVQQLTAARAIIGHKCYMWSTQKILDRVEWLSVKQLHLLSPDAHPQSANHWPASGTSLNAGIRVPLQDREGGN